MSVAVVIPVRNGATTIASTVRAVLAQSLPPDELVVVDNGSTDGTAEVATAAGARVVHEATPGSYAARNAGVAATTAALLAFTDADCIPRPDWLAGLVAAFDDPAVMVAGGDVLAPRAVTAAERWASARHVLDQRRAFAGPGFRPFFATANVAWRRTMLERIGGFDADLRSGGDVDACWRAQACGGALRHVPGAVVDHPHRARVRDLLAQQCRYAHGHGRLDSRWRFDPVYRRAMGSWFARTRAVWLTPLRVPWRLLRGTDPAVALIDAAVRVGHEAGRWRGRRRPPLRPLPGAPTAAPAASVPSIHCTTVNT